MTDDELRTKTHSRCPLCHADLRGAYHHVQDRLQTSRDDYRVDECTSCGLGLINPAPTGDLSRFYPERYLSQETNEDGSSAKMLLLAERIYRENQYDFDFKILRAAVGIDIADSRSYLDVGCGSGERVSYVRSKGCDRSVGIDRFDFGKRSAQANGELIQTEVLAYRPEVKYQVVSMFHVLEHVENPVEILRHLHDYVVSPDGVVIIQVPNYASFERRAFGRRWFGLDAPRHLFQFDARTTTEVLKRAGFSAVRVVRRNAALHPVTLVPSLVPSLDVQRIWVRPGSRWGKLLAQLAWAALTVAVIPVAWLQNLVGQASMLTVVAVPSSVRES